MSDTKTFRIHDKITIQGICHEVEMYLQNVHGLITEKTSIDNGYVIQARETSTLKKITGVGMSLYIKIFPFGTEHVDVFIDKGKWSDRNCLINIVGNVVPLFPYFNMFGAFKQYKLPQEVFSCIEKYISSSGLSSYSEAKVRCSACGTINPHGLKECAFCGKLLE